MILRINKKPYDSNRVPLMIKWTNLKAKETFVKELISINQFSKAVKMEGFSYIIVEHGVYDTTADISIKFVNREEKSSTLRQLNTQGADCNIYVITPEDIPVAVIQDWSKKMLEKIRVKGEPSVVEFL
jgi:hypothetical protein